MEESLPNVLGPASKPQQEDESKLLMLFLIYFILKYYVYE